MRSISPPAPPAPRPLLCAVSLGLWGAGPGARPHSLSAGAGLGCVAPPEPAPVIEQRPPKCQTGRSLEQERGRASLGLGLRAAPDFTALCSPPAAAPPTGFGAQVHRAVTGRPPGAIAGTGTCPRSPGEGEGTGPGLGGSGCAHVFSVRPCSRPRTVLASAMCVWGPDAVPGPWGDKVERLRHFGGGRALSDMSTCSGEASGCSRAPALPAPAGRRTTEAGRPWGSSPDPQALPGAVSKLSR